MHPLLVIGIVAGAVALYACIAAIVMGAIDDLGWDPSLATTFVMFWPLAPLWLLLVYCFRQGCRIARRRGW